MRDQLRMSKRNSCFSGNGKNETIPHTNTKFIKQAFADLHYLFTLTNNPYSFWVFSFLLSLCFLLSLSISFTILCLSKKSAHGQSTYCDLGLMTWLPAMCLIVAARKMSEVMLPAKHALAHVVFFPPWWLNNPMLSNSVLVAEFSTYSFYL